MATTRAITILLLTSLPLVALTARAFVVRSEVRSPSNDVPRYNPDPALEGRIKKEIGRLIAAEGDPTGWTTATGVEALPSPYDIAAVIHEADRAALDADAVRIDTAFVEVKKLLDEPRRMDIEKMRPAGHLLVAALRKRKESLEEQLRRLADRAEAHRRWLEDRATVAGEIRKAEAALEDQSIDQGSETALGILRALRQHFPGIVADDDEAETASRRTKSEDASMQALLKRADFRHDFQKAQQAESGIKRIVALGDFVRKYELVSLDERDRALLDDAKELFTQATRDLLWSKVRGAKNVDAFTQSLCEWLRAAPDADSGPKARSVIDDWLAKRITAGPDETRFVQLEEGIVDGERGRKRLLGIFAKDEELHRWRWWTDRAQKANEGLSKGDRPPVKLVGEPEAPPVLVDLLVKYRRLRSEFMIGPVGLGQKASPGSAFANACDDLGRKARSHISIPVVPANPHPLQQAYDAVLEEFMKVLREAAEVTREFDAAVHCSGLVNELNQ